MSTYRVADGPDIVLGSLTVLDPQPRSEGMKSSRRTYAPAAIYDEAKYVELEWDIFETVAQYQAMLTTFGINAALTNEVTVYVRDETYTFVRMNGTVVRPEIGRDARWRGYFARDVKILVKNLVASS